MGPLVQWLKLPACKVGDRGLVPHIGILVSEKQILLPRSLVKIQYCGHPPLPGVAYSISDRQGSNFESCVRRTVSSQSSHHPQEVLLAQFSLYVHKGGLKPDSFHFPPRSLVKIQYSGHPPLSRVAYSISDRQGSNFESCVWRAVSSHSSHHPQEVLLAQFCLFAHKGGLKPH